MRNKVLFQHPAEFVPNQDTEGVLSVDGAIWFLEILQVIPGIHVDEERCQEDWGVVFFARRNGSRFWIGLSAWMDDDADWLVHVHHRSFAWFQRWSRSGRDEFKQLVLDLHRVMESQAEVSNLRWYNRQELESGHGEGSPCPRGPVEG